MWGFLQAEDGIRVLVRSRGLGDVYKRQDAALRKRALGLDAGAPQRGQRPAQGIDADQQA